MARKRLKRPTPRPLGWAFLLLFLLVTFLAALWILRPLKEKEKVYLRPKVFVPPLTERKRARHPKRKKPFAAIIIDDMGQRPWIERKFFHLGLCLNFSFLPFAPYTKTLAQEAHQLGFEVLIHLPLESGNGEKTPGLITLKMNEREVKRRVKRAFLAVPYAIGVNHHEGSKFTTDYRHTRWLLEEVKSLGLFYVDSRTTPLTVVPKVAQELGLSWAERRVFLDHDPRREAIKREIRRLIRRAYRVGPTIAIGHPHPETLKALHQEKTRLLTEIDLVPISVMVQKFQIQRQRKRP